MWRKSTFSATDINCVEVDMDWRKSSASGPNDDNCVEVVVDDDGQVLIRESDEPDVIVATTPAKWRAFVAGVKAGEFDL